MRTSKIVWAVALVFLAGASKRALGVRLEYEIPGSRPAQARSGPGHGAFASLILSESNRRSRAWRAGLPRAARALTSPCAAAVDRYARTCLRAPGPPPARSPHHQQQHTLAPPPITLLPPRSRRRGRGRRCRQQEASRRQGRRVHPVRVHHQGRQVRLGLRRVGLPQLGRRLGRLPRLGRRRLGRVQRGRVGVGKLRRLGKPLGLGRLLRVSLGVGGLRLRRGERPGSARARQRARACALGVRTGHARRQRFRAAGAAVRAPCALGCRTAACELRCGIPLGPRSYPAPPTLTD